jgi:hypothetical protein
MFFSKMTAGSEIITLHRKEMMNIQPSDNSMNAHEAKPAQESQQRKVAPADSVVTELGKEFETFVRKALRMEALEKESVEQTRTALSDGTLDTPQAHQAAADNLLQYGI